MGSLTTLGILNDAIVDILICEVEICLRPDGALRSCCGKGEEYEGRRASLLDLVNVRPSLVNAIAAEAKGVIGCGQS